MDKPKEIRASDYREIYSNQSTTKISPWDISIVFSLGQTDVDKTPFIEEKIAVTFSPHQFKALAFAVQNALNAFEQSFGAINVPSNFIPSVQKPDELKNLMAEAMAAEKANH